MGAQVGDGPRAQLATRLPGSPGRAGLRFYWQQGLVSAVGSVHGCPSTRIAKRRQRPSDPEPGPGTAGQLETGTGQGPRAFTAAMYPPTPAHGDVPARYLHVTCLYLQLHVAVAAVTRRVPWPASNASTATCEYRFLRVSFHTLPALQLRQLHVALPASRSAPPDRTLGDESLR